MNKMMLDFDSILFEDDTNSSRVRNFRNKRLELGFIKNMSLEEARTILKDVDTQVRAVVGTVTENTDVSPAVVQRIEAASLSAVTQLFQVNWPGSTSLDMLIGAIAGLAALFGCSINDIPIVEQRKLEQAVVAYYENFARLTVTQITPEDLSSSGEYVSKAALLVRIDELNSDFDALSDKYEQLFKTHREKSEAYAKLQDKERRLNQKVAALESELIAAKETIANLEQAKTGETIVVEHTDAEHIAELTAELASVRYQLKAAQADVSDSTAVRAQMDSYVWLVEESDAISPSGPIETIELIQRLFPNKVRFSKKALDDAKKWPGNPSELWRALRALVLKWLPLEIDGGVSTKLDVQAVIGFEVTPNESSGTKTSKKFIQQRRASINGKVIEATHHLKGGSISGTNVLRIYFTYNPELQCIDIIRCGGHLETIGQKKKGY